MGHCRVQLNTSFEGGYTVNLERSSLRNAASWEGGGDEAEIRTLNRKGTLSCSYQ